MLEADWRRWDLLGLKVTQIRFDHSFHVHMWSLERDLSISFGTPFTLCSSTGEVHSIDPALQNELRPLLALLHRSVSIFSASSAGQCALLFEDGTELRGNPHEIFEAWESHGGGSLESASLLCTIGGGSPWE
jgi:Family of unknown function (DUF6188)